MRSIMKRFWAFLAGFCAFSGSVASAGILAEDSTTLLRVADTHPTAALVIFPGAFLAAAQYIGLAQSVVERSAGEIAVFVPHFTADFPNPLEAESRVREVINILGNEGVERPNARVFVGGHSVGGIFANDLPNTLQLPGLVLLGSYLPHTAVIGKKLRDYPFPTLTLGGELDGLTGINYLARESAALQALAGADVSSLITKPVIVLPGVVHMQFADGAPIAGDTIRPEASLSSAHAAMAEVIVNFVATHASLRGLKIEAAAEALRIRVMETETLLRPYTLAAVAEAGVCAALQRVAVPLQGSRAWDQLSIDTKIYRHGREDLAFVLDKSAVAAAGSGYVLHLPMLIDDEVELADVSNDHYLAPRSLFCKMRTAAKLTEETGFATEKLGQNCAELNAKVILDTLATLNPDQRARFNAKFGDFAAWTQLSSAGDGANIVQLGPLRIRSEKVASGPHWIMGAFRFGQATGGLWHIDTIELITGPEVLIPRFAGANYCKVMAPKRVIEWATVFALK